MPIQSTRDELPTEHSLQPKNLSEVVKFTALAAALAIFVDAAVAHAMMWGNDPYWTYWVTDTLLMATVFGLGTMLFGIGIGRGALITAVHVTLLTTYYWSLSPIGLPSHPEWLDFEHTWATGLPIHLAVYYLGYIGAFWLWNQRRARAFELGHVPTRSLAGIGATAFVVTGGVVIATGLIQTLVLGEFPGLTWFVMRIAVAFPFTIGWWMTAGNGRVGAIAGGIVLAFLLITYSHYLGPVGLPTDPPRVFGTDSPPALVSWLSYREEFMIMLPLTALVAGIAYVLAAGRWNRASHSVSTPASRKMLLASFTAGAGLVVVGILTAPHLGPDANRATITAVGSATAWRDDRNEAFPVPAASLRVSVENRNTHRTPLPPHDRVDLAATLPGTDGKVYEISANQPMVADASGRFTTWHGVSFGNWHDGRSAIGIAESPPRKSRVLAFAFGEIRSDGKLVATGVPMQIAATEGETRLLELHLDERISAIDVPAHVSWQDFAGDYLAASTKARYLFGGAVLLVFLGFAFGAAWRIRVRSQRH